MNTYFTSDWHLWHANIIKYAKRPYKNVIEMNNAILDMFYFTVEKGDTVYFLGDFAFSKKAKQSEIKDVLSAITNHCTFHCILGNHDYSMRELLEDYCASVSPLKVISVRDQKITLCHFPMVSFSGSHHNNWQLYGHHHRDTNKQIRGKRYNVSLEANSYQLVSFDKLQKIMKKRDNNWDFISPERRRRRKQQEDLTRELAKAKEKLSKAKKKITKEFLENAPKKVIEEQQTRIAKIEQQIRELERSIKS